MSTEVKIYCGTNTYFWLCKHLKNIRNLTNIIVNASELFLPKKIYKNFFWEEKLPFDCAIFNVSVVADLGTAV
jgi:hypothetical protein